MIVNDRVLNMITKFIIYIIFTFASCIVFNILYEAFLSFRDRQNMFGMITSVIAFFYMFFNYIRRLSFVYNFEITE